MVYVRLERPWTDASGTRHQAGAMVDVDAGTLVPIDVNSYHEIECQKSLGVARETVPASALSSVISHCIIPRFVPHSL
jgi:hypothetical protein